MVLYLSLLFIRLDINVIICRTLGWETAVEQYSQWVDKQEEDAAAADEHRPDEKGTQPYTEQTTAEKENSAVDETEQEEGRDHVPLFSHCDEPITELFGRAYSDFKAWLDGEGEVQLFAPQNVDVKLFFFKY